MDAITKTKKLKILKPGGGQALGSRRGGGSQGREEKGRGGVGIRRASPCL